MAEPTYEDGWQPIATCPVDEERDDDLPSDAIDGIGFATAASDGRLLFLLWWRYGGGGYSHVSHWRPLPGPPA